ncbi:unnamed protein product [Acanthoscelides obtectus]|uniref:Uncharacterized protein n=1 Tax=Acanthoscelides obtectus TaxID=200917 RepID=A0A9P0LGL7_ACAOB|nr:unnamed protein product [Acanthoscelides obtectus]CAK1640296.1 hypothetical protein AOBTE_LOCUS11644 [Acanthoscelides obtectus]
MKYEYSLIPESIFPSSRKDSFISSSLPLKQASNTPPMQRSMPSPESAYDTMMRNPEVAETFGNAIDRDLVEKVIEYVKERSLDEETGCLQLLICKSRPFFRRMQEVIAHRGNNTEFVEDAMYGYFPNVEEVADYADMCERKHPYCNESKKEYRSITNDKSTSKNYN